MRFVSAVAIALAFAGGGVARAQGDLIFADGFEDGTPFAWSVVVGYTINPVIDLRADVNRNGTVDLTDPSEDQDEDTWDSSHGAIFIANMDDDQSACPTTGTDPELAACHDAADEVVNGPDDELDLARLVVVPWPSAPDDASAVIALSTPGAAWVRMFRRVGASFVLFDSAVESLTAADLRGGVELAMEATDIVRDSASWDGFVDITLDVEAGTGSGGPLQDWPNALALELDGANPAP